MAVTLLLLSCADEAGNKAGATYQAGPPPMAYLERTAWLWALEDHQQPEAGGVFFNFTGGNLSGQPPQPYNDWPTILVGLPEGWRVVEFKEGFSQFMWSHAAAAPEKGYLWGFLEYSVEDGGKEIPVVMSVDKGRTWAHVATIEKPDHEATLQAFEMNTKGEGQIQVALEKDAAPGTRKIFTYVTKNWGKNWRRGSSFELSALEAGRVPRDDVPCWVAVRNLPTTPLPEVCRFPERVQTQLTLREK
jgi:hypothetical protein